MMTKITPSCFAISFFVPMASSLSPLYRAYSLAGFAIASPKSATAKVVSMAKYGQSLLFVRQSHVVVDAFLGRFFCDSRHIDF